MSGIPPQEPLPPSPGDFEEELPPVPEQPRPHRTRAIKKGRPRRKKGEGLFGIPNILVTGVWVALVLLISITLGRMVWVCASEILAFGREDKSVTITVYETDTIDDITKKLARAELIHYPGLFKLYAQFAVDEGDIHPGMWDLNTKYDYHALVKMMSPSSSRSTVKVMIPEGYTCRQIFALLEENKVCTVQDISSYSAYGELNDYWFLDGVTRGDKYCLEGFLFPDTYLIMRPLELNEATAKSVVGRLIDNFWRRTAPLWPGGKRPGPSGRDEVRRLVTLASIVERETAVPSERPRVAGVYANRLRLNMLLQADPTTAYGLGESFDGNLRRKHLDDEGNPYNTYKHPGLPPGPICSPGLACLKAAANPEQHDYIYFVARGEDGSHVFSTNLAAHNKAVREYWAKRRGK